MSFLHLVAAAHAFCGTFVGGDGALLANTQSRVVLANDGLVTTLTFAVDYQGAAAEFAMLLPVPQVLGPEDVGTVPAELLTRIDEWSTPREVAYTCDDVVSSSINTGGCGFALGCAAESALDGAVGDEGATADGSVTVEASFSEAGYEFVVLSAEESAGLQTWLDDNGYALPAGGDAVLQEYIDAGVYFLAAKVALAAADGEVQWLPPIQLRYESSTWSLPIRIGTISAEGTQEVTVFALGDSAQGEVAIANYPEVTVEDECMRPDAANLGEYYRGRLDEAFAGQAGWIQEYSWDLTANCDPCTSAQGLTPEELEQLGLMDYHGHLSRMRLRYTPEQATADLALYSSGVLGGAEQIRFIQYAETLEATFPICGEGMVADPAGTCLGEDRIAVLGIAAWSPLGLLGAGALVYTLRRRRA